MLPLYGRPFPANFFFINFHQIWDLHSGENPYFRVLGYGTRSAGWYPPTRLYGVIIQEENKMVSIIVPCWGHAVA
jgi:hypothetical protein